MSDTQEQAPAPDSKPAAEQAPAPTQGEEGRKPVPMDPDTQARFNRVYGHMKQNERVIDSMASQMRLIVENQQRLEAEAEQRGRAKAIAELKEKHTAALERADFKAAGDAAESIAELKAEEKLAAKKPPAGNGQAEPALLPPDVQVAIQAWQAETDANGNFKRPWAQAGHPKNRRAVSTAAGVFEDPEFTTQGVAACLREVDRLMGTPTVQRTAANVLSDDAGARPSTRAAPLSQDEKLIAHRMYSELPRLKAEERYREAKQKYGRAS